MSDSRTAWGQEFDRNLKLFGELDDAKRLIKQLEIEKAELLAQVEYVKSHFNELIEVAQRCDSWESFPQKPLDRAAAALESLATQCLNQIKAEAVQEFANYACDSCESDLKCQLIDKVGQYAASIARWSDDPITKRV